MLRSLLLLLLCLCNFISYANDDCSNAITLTPGTSCSNTTGTFSGATPTGAATSCANESLQDVWYKFTATDVTNGIYLNAVMGLNHGMEIRQGGCDGPVIACKNDYLAGSSESYVNNNFIVGQEYFIRVFNATAQLTTASFTICVMKFPAPDNDLCANATQLTPGTTCAYTAGTFSGTQKDGGVPACAPNASQDVWYRFTATDATMSILLSDSQYLNHGLEIYQGGCDGTLVTCRNNNIDGISESYFNNSFIVGQEYYLRVFNASSALTTRSFNICVTAYPNQANDLCADATQLTPGTSCNYTAGTFSGTQKDGGVPACAANASQDVWYKFTATDATMSILLSDSQYLNHGLEIYQGGCNGTLVTCRNNNIDGISESYFNNSFIVDQEYYIRVINASSALSTRNFNICVTGYPNQANDLCANATQLTPGTTCTYTAGTFSGTQNDGGVPSCAPNASQDVWYKFTATDATMSILLSDSQYLNHGFEIYQGGCNGALVTCRNNNIDGISESYFNNSFIVGQEYYIRVFNASSALSTRSFNICVTGYPNQANDLCDNATQLTPGTSCNYTAGTFSGTMLDGGTASCATSASQDVWYKFSATAATMSLSLSAVQYLNHGFEIRQGGCTGTVVACKNDYTADGNGESYTGSSFIIGQEYYVRVFNASSALTTRSFGICVVGPPPAACTPLVTISASTTSICQGQSVTFIATPTNGGTTPTYQWKVGSTNVGPNSPTYTTTTLGNGDVVSVVMTTNEPCASVTTAASNTISINVTTPVSPVFTQIPAICTGGSFTLPTTSANEVTGTWSPAINNTATTTYTFTPTAGQCAFAATMTVSVNSDVTPTFTQIATICTGGSFTLPTTSSNGVTGTWSPEVNNNATTTYTFTPTTGQCAATATMTVTVNNNVTPIFSQVAAICPGASFTLPTTSTNGVTGTWTPEVNDNATTTYTFTPTTGQCAATATMIVSVTDIDTEVTVSANSITAATLPPDATYQWINCANNQSIAGETSPTYVVTQDGTYAVVITENGCSATSECTVISGLAIKPIEKSDWKLYPIPASDLLYIDTDEATGIVITDMTGKTVAGGQLKSGQNSISVSGLSSGIYIINSDSGAHVKFIKK